MPNQETADYNKYVFTVCLAYGSREEMLKAIQSIAAEHAAGDLPLQSIDEKAVSSRLYTGEMPDPDLVIRTSGEERISNFLLWQMAYSELYFTDVYWPSFQKKDLLKAVKPSKTESADMVNNMVTCDECNGWLNPALAVDAVVQRGEEILVNSAKNSPQWQVTGRYLVALLNVMKTHSLRCCVNLRKKLD